MIEEIISNIQHQLPSSSTFPNLVGVDYPIHFITSWLNDGSTHTNDILTISGMAGIGKTSLAKYIFESHCRLFQRSSFVDDINRNCPEQSNKVLGLQKQILADISKEMPIQVDNVYEYTSMIMNALASKKVLLVLDDIDSIDKLDALLGYKGFHPGSKIIITTKEASLTERCALFHQQVQPKHTKLILQNLNETSSLQLLRFHAFKGTSPTSDYKQVSKNLAKVCGGHPLSLKVMGRALFDQDVADWEEYTEELKKYTDSRVEKILRMSFDSLSSYSDKELFKYIACFFVGKDKDSTETILKACGIRTALGMKNLVDRFLITIGPRNELMMHQLLQDMGRDVVRQESAEKPWERSLLWCQKDAFHVLKRKKGKGNLKGIALDMRMLEKEKLHGSLNLDTNAFSNMANLMLLQINYAQLHGPYTNFPKKLRWLCMHQFPSEYIPSDLPMGNLVALDLSYSNFESFDMSFSDPQQLGKTQKLAGPSSKYKRLLGSLKILNLSFCNKLRSLGGFIELPALERLMATNCKGLTEVSESIDQCVELVIIDLSFCSKLEMLPRTVENLKKVKTLLLDDCHLHELPIVTTKPLVPNFPVSLSSSLVRLSLANNNLSIESFPMDFSFLSVLKDLYLDGNPIVSLPSCVRSLERLEILSMDGCTMLMSVELPPRTLKYLKLDSYSRQNNFLRKIVFDPEMSPLKLSVDPLLLAPSTFEIEGMVKIQPIAGVEGKVLHSLGWTDIEFTKERRVETSHLFRGSEGSQIQMYYEFGIFSTFYGGEAMPNWISHGSKGTSVSFTIPSSPNKLTGLNFCYTIACPDQDSYLMLSKIKISNITKNLTWIYHHYIDSVNVAEESLIFLSHWMFGKNEMEDDDQVTITTTEQLDQPTRECGISFVYDDGNNKEDDVLGYYKSWNHIIGGDLSAFQTTTGEYILNNTRFLQHGTHEVLPIYLPLIADGSTYKEEEVWFEAFSKQKSDMLDFAPENERSYKLAADA
ncbi:disease resistance protein RML1B-like protein [Tanacetum coccineum]